MAFYFRCISNREGGPLFITEEVWEAEDMRRHPDYEELNADGELVTSALAGAPAQIPMHAPQPEVPAKRKTLTLKK